MLLDRTFVHPKSILVSANRDFRITVDQLFLLCLALSYRNSLSNDVLVHCQPFSMVVGNLRVGNNHRVFVITCFCGNRVIRHLVGLR